jgi:hypothetical protein
MGSRPASWKVRHAPTFSASGWRMPRMDHRSIRRARKRARTAYLVKAGCGMLLLPQPALVSTPSPSGRRLVSISACQLLPREPKQVVCRRAARSIVSRSAVGLAALEPRWTADSTHNLEGRFRTLPRSSWERRAPLPGSGRQSPGTGRRPAAPSPRPPARRTLLPQRRPDHPC